MRDRTDRVRLIVEGIEFAGLHGVHEQERRQGNRFLVDVEILADLSSAIASDRLEDTVDYAAVVRCVEDVNRQRTYHLIESFAGAMSRELLSRFPQADEVLVRLKKISPPGLGGNVCATAEVRTTRRDGR